MKLDLEDLYNVSSADIDGFTQMLLEHLPTLEEHHCSYGRKGGFILRLKEGTMFGHIAEHVCLELQNLADMEVNFGKTRESPVKGVYNVVYSFVDEEAGKMAGRVSVELLNNIVERLKHPDKNIQPYNIKSKLISIKHIESKNYLGPSTKSIVDEAEKRDIPYIRLNRFNLLQLGQGKYQKKVEATITSNTSVIAMDIAKNVEYFSKELEKIGIPTSKARYCYEFSEALEYFNTLKAPVMLKPSNTRNGIGITLNIQTKQELEKAFDYASNFNDEYIIERYIEGSNYRILVVNGEFLAASKRYPAKIKGDGNSTTGELIEMENEKGERNIRMISALSKIEVNESLIKSLSRKGLGLDSVLDEGKELELNISCKHSLGGYSVNITDWVDIENRKLVEKVAKLTDLDVAGIDIIATTLREPLIQSGGAVTGINVSPDFRIHTHPLKGSPINVAKPVLDMLFPPDGHFMIPIVSITGTCGKTTVSKMVSHILTMRGFNVGLANSDGLYFRDDLIVGGDRTSREDMLTVFKNPEVDFSVFETKSETITFEGIGYQRADVGVILNISEEYRDTTGWKDVNDIAYVKLLVAEQLERWGFAVLNADDDITVSLRDYLRSDTILFTTKRDNPVIKKHLADRGIAVIYHKGEFSICIGNNTENKIASVYEIPITYDGKSVSGIYNVLATIATVYGVWKTLPGKEKRTISLDDIKIGITSFSPSFNNNPFRINRFFIKDSIILLDSPANPSSFENYSDFIKKMTRNKRIGLIYNLKTLTKKCWENSALFLKGVFNKIFIVYDKDRKEDYAYCKDIVRYSIIEHGGFTETDIVLKPSSELDKVIKKVFEVDKNNALCIFSKNKKVIELVLEIKEEVDPLY